MTQWLRHYWVQLRTSYWFLPAMMTALAAFLGLLLVRVDEIVEDHWILELRWIYTGSADGARQLLATVAGSMITVAGVVFSITIVALSLASNQFGPRLLRNFMRDRGNQIVLGTFIATFAYCLVVLRTVRGENEGDFVPQIAVSGAVLLALASVGVLIYFIHHAAVSVQAPVIIANVSRELRSSLSEIFPEELGQPSAESPSPRAPDGIPDGFESEARPVLSSRDGYVQAINNERLMSTAAEKALIVRIERQPGQFVVAGDPLALIWPARWQEVEQQIRDSFIIGSQQSSEQDAEFIMNQLVEVAVRALSPGINDPFTAFNCLDHLGAALNQLTGRKMPSPYRVDQEGRLRIIAPPLSFAQLADTAFQEIRRYGRTSGDVLAHMLDVMAMVLRHVRREEDRDALVRHATLVYECGRELPLEADRREVHQRFEQILSLSKKSLNSRDEVNAPNGRR